MERSRVNENEVLEGYDALKDARTRQSTYRYKPIAKFSPNAAYERYHRIHKVLVGKSGGSHLEAIGEALENEELPDFLNTSAWAFAESALIQADLSTSDRSELLDKSCLLWERALSAQEAINGDDKNLLREYVASYRFAVNLAFMPLMRAIIAKDVTNLAIETVFRDVLAIAQASTVQCYLANKDGDIGSASEFRGFEHECNAYLSLLFMNDPRYIPLPSSARGGSGYDYPDQTHDIIVVNQHWGKILKTVPVEIKSKASLGDLKRYKALIVRGKMHLSVSGYYTPDHTQKAFAAVYEGSATKQDRDIVDHVTGTFRELLQLYQKGSKETTQTTSTRFHGTSHLIERFPEFSIERAKYKATT